MQTNRTTKRALLGSLTSLLLCFAMLIGSTFAWFTDTASTSVNTIQAGTLDVRLLDASNNSLEGTTLKWQKAEGHENDPVLWEPGCTYSLQPITIKNGGSLALKYKIAITGIKGDAELNEAIDWTVSLTDTDNTTANTTFTADTEFKLAANAEATLTISGTMKTSAGNAYQGLSISGIAITVVATQDTVEYDSNGNTYDAKAEYPKTVETSISSSVSDINSEIKKALEDENLNDADTALIKLTNDSTNTRNVTVNYYSSGLSGAKKVTFDLAEGVVLKIDNVKVDNGQTFTFTGKGTIKNGYYGVAGGGTLILENEGGFEQENLGNAMIDLAKYGANVVIRNYELKNNTTSRHPLIMVGDGLADENGMTAPSKLTLENVTMDGTTHFSNNTTAKAAGIHVWKGDIDITTNNVTFNGSSELQAIVAVNSKFTDAFLTVESGNNCNVTLNGTTVQ